WNCEGGTTQTAYQIKTNFWDSGKITSSSMRHTMPFEFKSGQRVEFQIKLWDENDAEGEWSEVAFFEFGIKDFKAKWICGDYKIDKNTRYPVDCFKRDFTVDKAVKSARLYVTACGIYEAVLNNQRVGDFILAPGHTDYNKRIQYQTYDITNQLKNGNNSIEVQLADGWYRGSCGAWGLVNQYGKQTKLLAQLEIIFDDGSSQTIISDNNWRWSNDGPIRFADNKDGEIVDANKTPSYMYKAVETKNTVIPTASNNVFVTEHERFKPHIKSAKSGKIILDFKQNIAGYIEFKVNAKGGEKITLRCGEMLDENGELTLKNIQCVSKKKATPLQKVEYICKAGENHYKTKFAIFGFQYVEVDTDIKINADDFTAIAVYSDLEETGCFDSSNQLLNQFVKNTMWSLKNNSADVPTDCPTRERHGWTGDSQIFCESAGYLMNYMPFAKKHLNDVYDWQRKDGCLPQIAPAGGVDFYMYTMNGSVGWADAGVLIPYRYWKLFCDDSIIVNNYDKMARYARFMMKRCGKFGLMAKPLGLKGEAKKYAVNAGQSYGEWAEPADVYPNKWTDMVAPHPEVSTAYTSYIMSLMAEIAEYLGKAEDAKLYKKYADKVKLAYQALVETKDYSLDTDRQAQLVRPLYLNLLNEKQTALAKERLVKALENYGWRIGTGFLSTSFILYVLADIDVKYAYKLLENEEMPGWLFMPKMGATTIWESWEGTAAQGGIASLNHYSKGAVCEWLFNSMCGIKVTGDNHFTIAPTPGGNFSYANAEYKSVFGIVKSGWKKTDSGYIYEIEIPSNTTAEIILPDGKRESVSAGKYNFTV
ncbi:MAG: glycoside hydrolase family 78 protein, partial [Clostridia bacterium]|nr:glycoside hydrolase family 78 protein [Clostridia bacterium]